MSHILVLDDSRAQRKLISKMLTNWGHQVTCCERPQDALEALQDTSISLILTDWIMPEMSGPEFCRAFRKMERESYAYVILLTSKSEKAEIAQGLEAGADDFVSKPVDGHELRARIRAGERIVRMQQTLVEQNRHIRTNLAEIRELYDALDRDLKEAQGLQESLVRETFKDLGTAQISLTLKASGHVGGDLVGFFPISDTCVGLFSLDVSGHGVTSALLAARLAGLLGTAAPEQNVAMEPDPAGGWRALPPGDVAQKLNRIMFEEMTTELYFTLGLAEIDLCTGKGRMVQAGHPHPVVQSKTGEIDWIGTGGMPVGLLPDAEFDDFPIQLQPGDRLFLYSDGITELGHPLGGFLGEDGLAEILKNSETCSGPEMLPRLVADLEAYCGRSEFEDDVSAVVFDFKR